MLPMNVTLVSKLLESFKPHSALQSSGIIGANNTSTERSLVPTIVKQKRSLEPTKLKQTRSLEPTILKQRMSLVPTILNRQGHWSQQYLTDKVIGANNT